MKKFDVIVLGLGAMGSATVYQLSKRGSQVLGLDQFSPPHPKGSTHGETRITRLAIGEGEEYVDFAVRSHEIWKEIERESGKTLLFSVGGLIISSPDTKSSAHVPNFFSTTLDVARKKNITHEELDAAAIRRRFPQFRIEDSEHGYFEPEAGYLSPEECVRVQLDLAKKYGATLQTNEKVTEFRSDGSEVTVKTESNTYIGKRLVLTAGPWLPDLIGPTYSAHLKVYRQVLYWFDIRKEAEGLFTPKRFPVFIWNLPDKKYGIYGFPAVDGPDGGVKIATEQLEKTTTPEHINREVSSEEIVEMFENFVAPYFPGLTGQCPKEPVTCMYTATEGARFLIDWHPEHRNVFVVSPCSGHGFKHSPAIGEVVAQAVLGEQSKLDISKFSFEYLT
jgi:sarcosine oxidase